MRFGARIEALKPFVPTLTILAGDAMMMSNTSMARQIASDLDSFANEFG